MMNGRGKMANNKLKEAFLERMLDVTLEIGNDSLILFELDICLEYWLEEDND